MQTRDGQIVLTPVRIQRGDAVRAKLAELELTEADIGDAVTWARTSSIPKAPAKAAAKRHAKVQREHEYSQAQRTVCRPESPPRRGGMTRLPSASGSAPTAP